TATAHRRAGRRCRRSESGADRPGVPGGRTRAYGGSIMIAKEIREAWWKVLIGLVTPLVTAASLGLSATEVDPGYVAHRLSVYPAVTSRPIPLYDSWVWIQVFTLSTGATVLFLVVAALLGASLVVSEVTRGTIFFLLTRSQSRDHILLTKYGVGAALLLGLA